MGLDNPLHIAVLLLVVLLVFGAKRLPELGRSLGEGMRGFRDSIGGESKDDAAPLPPPPAAGPPVPAPAPVASDHPAPYPPGAPPSSAGAPQEPAAGTPEAR